MKIRLYIPKGKNGRPVELDADAPRELSPGEPVATLEGTFVVVRLNWCLMSDSKLIPLYYLGAIEAPVPAGFYTR